MNDETTWVGAPSVLVLPDDEIHVWRASLDQEPAVAADLKDTLSEDEKARATRFHFERDQCRFIVARGLLRRMLADYLRQEPNALRFCYGPKGKPSLRVSNTWLPEISFNLAHTNGQAVYAFALSRCLGIDIEMIRDDFPAIEIAKRFFSLKEIDQLLDLSRDERHEAFFLGWTRKEAYIKALGEGLHIELDSFSVTLLPGREACFLHGVDSDWHLVSFSSNGVPGALVHDGPKCSIRYLNISVPGLQGAK